MSVPWFVWAQQTTIKSFLQLVTGFLLGGKADSLNIGWQASFFSPFFYSALLSLYFPCTIHPSTSTCIPPSVHPLLCFCPGSLPFSHLFPDSFTTYYIFHYPLSSSHLSHPPPLLTSTSHPTYLSSSHLSMSLFFSSCSSRQPSWPQATEVTSRLVWLSPPRRSTRWGHSTSTASHPPPWPRCRVSFIKPWVSTHFHSLCSCQCEVLFSEGRTRMLCIACFNVCCL